MEKRAAELIETAENTADRPALCLRALSELSSLHIPNKVSFFMSTNGLNRVGSLQSNPQLKPVIRKAADDLLTLWMRQLYSPTPSGKPRQSNTKTLQNPNPKAAAEKLALELVEIAIRTATTVSQPLDDRCIRALSKLRNLNLGSDFIVSSDIANKVDYSLCSNGRLKPLIRGYARHLLARWTIQLTSDKKPQNKTKVLQNPKPARKHKRREALC